MKHIFFKLDRFFDHHWQIGILRPSSGCRVISPDPEFIPYFKAQNAHQCHILMKPLKSNESAFLLIDDISWKIIENQHQFNNAWLPGRLVIETSPKNFQVWLRFSHPLPLFKKNQLLQSFHSDPACYPLSRYGRCPGFRNVKPSHRDPDGLSPLSKLVWIDYVNFADLPSSHSIANPILRRHYDKGNESQTDFAFTLALIRKGFSDPDIKNLILRERSDWSNHSGYQRKLAYLDRTIKKARAIISN